MDIRRGQIYFVYLDPCFGREIGGYKMRPVLVLSVNDMNRRTRVATVVPGTSTPTTFSNVVRIQRDQRNGLESDTYFQCQQIRTLDPGRMSAPAIGEISSADMKRIEKAVQLVLGLPG